MSRNLAAGLLVLAMGSAAWAQEEVSLSRDPALTFMGGGEVEFIPKIPLPELGLRVGYLKERDADKGTWFAGVQIRYPLTDMFTLEGSIEFHTSDFADGEIEVITYPVQASVLIFPLPKTPMIAPYVVAGLGWYYTTVDFSGSLSAFDSQTESMFGAHIGFGAKMSLGGASTVSADLRYIFLEPNSDELKDEQFDTIQLVLSISFPF